MSTSPRMCLRECLRDRLYNSPEFPNGKRAATGAGWHPECLYHQDQCEWHGPRLLDLSRRKSFRRRKSHRRGRLRECRRDRHYKLPGFSDSKRVSVDLRRWRRGRLRQQDSLVYSNTSRYSVSADPTMLWPPNGKMVPVTVSGAITDACSFVTAAEYSVIDEYGEIQPSGPVTLGAGRSYLFAVLLQASRSGSDGLYDYATRGTMRRAIRLSLCSIDSHP